MSRKSVGGNTDQSLWSPSRTSSVRGAIDCHAAIALGEGKGREGKEEGDPPMVGAHLGLLLEGGVVRREPSLRRGGGKGGTGGGGGHTANH